MKQTSQQERFEGGTRWIGPSGMLHRTDGPAVEWTDGTKEWWVNGLRHRLDGPAIERADGSRVWYQNGQPRTFPWESLPLNNDWSLVSKAEPELHWSLKLNPGDIVYCDVIGTEYEVKNISYTCRGTAGNIWFSNGRYTTLPLNDSFYRLVTKGNEDMNDYKDQFCGIPEHVDNLDNELEEWIVGESNFIVKRGTEDHATLCQAKLLKKKIRVTLSIED
jgi:hypothetical protein